jgi:hypothetical protein
VRWLEEWIIAMMRISNGIFDWESRAVYVALCNILGSSGTDKTIKRCLTYPRTYLVLLTNFYITIVIEKPLHSAAL